MDLRLYFEIVDGELWRKECTFDGHKYKRKLIINRPNTSVQSKGGLRYCRFGFGKIKLFYHRVVYELTYGPIAKNKRIDHANGVGTDNNIKNLRLVTLKENARNTVRHRNGSTVGVTYDKHWNKWRCQCRDCKTSLGYHETEEEAISKLKIHRRSPCAR